MDKRKWLFLKWHQDQGHAIHLPVTVTFILQPACLAHMVIAWNSGERARFWHLGIPNGEHTPAGANASLPG